MAASEQILGRRLGLPDRAGDEPVPVSRRRRWLAAGVAAVVVAVCVVTDLPRRDTPALRRQDLSGFLAGLESGVGQCSAGVHDALGAYDDARLRPAELPMSTAARYVQDGIVACSFTNSGVVGLSSSQAPRTVMPLGVGALPNEVGLWASYDAFSTLQDLKAVVAHPGDAAARSAYEAEVTALDNRRGLVERIVVHAQALAGSPPTGLALTEVRGFSASGGGRAG